MDPDPDPDRTTHSVTTGQNRPSTAAGAGRTVGRVPRRGPDGGIHGEARETSSPAPSGPVDMQTTHSDTRDFIVMSGPDGPRLPQLPALDGVRGVAVAAVVLFHCGFEVMVGGFLGVSTFFTLSGFLITSLLLNESRRTGTVAVRQFWSRRFRRLLPASLVTLALVATLFAWFVATVEQRASLGGDVVASLFDVANWHFILQGSTYADLFAAPSPVLHFWSLAIEEQFYVVFPVVLLALWRVTRGRRGTLAVVLGGLAALSAALPLLFTMSDDRVYYGTDTRAAELLLGGVLAVALSYEPLRWRMALERHWRRWLSVAATLCLAVQAWWWFSLDQASPWLYRGGFAVYALMTCVVIAAVAVPRGPLASGFTAAPLRWLGLRSYAIYLAHWPIFLAVRQTLPDWSRPAQAVLGISASLLLAEISYRLLEQPIRLGRWPTRQWSVRIGGAAVLVVALLALVPMGGAEDLRTSSRIDFESAADELNNSSASADGALERSEVPTTVAAPDATVTTTTFPVEVPPLPRIESFGDSTALQTALALRDFRASMGIEERLGGSVALGCPLPRFEALQLARVEVVKEKCTDWPQRFTETLQADPADIAQLVTGTWDVSDARLPGASGFAGVGDPAVDDFVRGEYLLAVDTLAAQGALVVMVLWPEAGTWAADGQSAAVRRRLDPARTARLHEIQREVAALRPDTVRVIDFAGWFGDRAQDRALRSDGVHVEEPEMLQIYQEWLGGETDRIWAEWWQANRSQRAVAAAAAAAAATAAAAPTTTAPAENAPGATVPGPDPATVYVPPGTELPQVLDGMSAPQVEASTAPPPP